MSDLNNEAKCGCVQFSNYIVQPESTVIALTETWSNDSIELFSDNFIVTDAIGHFQTPTELEVKEF